MSLGWRVLGSLVLLALAACSGDSEEQSGMMSLAASCPEPAPISGLQRSRQGPYIVLLRDGVDSAVESTRLAAVYEFEASSVFLFGFEATMTPEAVQQVACEPTVEAIHFDDGSIVVL